MGGIGDLGSMGGIGDMGQIPFVASLCGEGGRNNDCGAGDAMDGEKCPGLAAESHDQHCYDDQGFELGRRIYTRFYTNGNHAGACRRQDRLLREPQRRG